MSGAAPRNPEPGCAAGSGPPSAPQAGRGQPPGDRAASRPPIRSSGMEELRDDAEEATGSARARRIDLGHALAEQIFQAAAESPIPGELAEPIEVGFAHVAAEPELASLGVEGD